MTHMYLVAAIHCFFFACRKITYKIILNNNSNKLTKHNDLANYCLISSSIIFHTLHKNLKKNFTFFKHFNWS